jgi:8-oxo-dGTP diphosphatase
MKVNTQITSYVCGFMFSDSLESVALIRKRRPSWQFGLLNGIGGHIEPNETPSLAMVREFSEEAGFPTTESRWLNFASACGPNNDGTAFDVQFFCATMRDLSELKTMTDEEIEIVNTSHIIIGQERIVGNLQWLIPLCIDFKFSNNPPKKIVAIY